MRGRLLGRMCSTLPGRRMSSAKRALPVIDIEPLVSGSASAAAVASAHEETTARSLDSASREYGFFHISGHGIAPSCISGAMRACGNFFHLPLEHKLLVRADPDAGEGTGWEPSGAQKLDESRLGEGIDGEQTMGDLKESYILGRPATSQLPPGAKPGELAALWPTSLGASFRDPLVQYHDECWRVSVALMRGWAIALGKPPDFFLRDTSDPMTKLRLLYYPPVDDARYAEAIGLGAHCDWGALTLLNQDEVGGLEVCAADGAWLPANCAGSDTLLVNVGDMLQRWTNGHFRSSPHRLLKPATAEASRTSIAFFFNCNVDANIDPRQVVPHEVPKWEPILAEAYIVERATATNQQE
eukprot:CAMPEP_0185443936 /NCGR_PEP_ID=MMETSP1365-20130426/48451_1 /TAXON_ID=38817 /ORGANISM="Gephyrocapsa oceanica, Strain RCC1303" /LENGTH=355 /DNA_ID=CAMNT_0028049581 /DNA_START=9 /DNA_END=1076 /DNA_ORIENTATION=+